MIIPGAHWYATTDGDARALALYLRHYSAIKNRARKSQHTHGHSWRRIVGPGERLILLTVHADALFVWRREKYRRDGERGVNCAVFRNESDARASLLVQEAGDLAWQRWPGERLFTFVDPRAIRPTRTPGRCFLKAGWRTCAHRTKERDLVVLERLPLQKDGQ